MTLQNSDVRKAVERLLLNTNHREIILDLINREFFEYVIGFFKRVMNAKLENEDITPDWYKEHFLSIDNNDIDDVIINSGLNRKSIKNAYKSERKSICLQASNENYDRVMYMITELLDSESGLDFTITIKHNGVSVDLTINESLIVINAIAVKRAALRGGAWSTLGKAVETPLMLTLCKLFSVNEDNYAVKKDGLRLALDQLDSSMFNREVDFYLINKDDTFNCEVKLMGQGNPESADAVVARASNVFVADSLLRNTKSQLDSRSVKWVELACPDGYRRFGEVLDQLNIPNTPPDDGLNSLSDILVSLFA